MATTDKIGPVGLDARPDTPKTYKEQLEKEFLPFGYSMKQAKAEKEAADAAANRKEEDAEVAAKRKKGYASGGKIRTTRGWGIARR